MSEKKPMETIDEQVIEEYKGDWIPDDKFCTFTMADVLERQGFKKDAMRIYCALLKKEGQDSLLIMHRIERLKRTGCMEGVSLLDIEQRKKDFINWVNKLQKEDE